MIVYTPRVRAVHTVILFHELHMMQWFVFDGWVGGLDNYEYEQYIHTLYIHNT
jgi:hypothetical protein